MQRLISALFEYQEYIILVFIPVLFGFADFWLIFFAKHFIKVLKYSYGFILPFVINLYYLYGLIQASLQSDFSATVSALAYFALSLSATFTYAILSISAHSFIKKK